MLHLSLGLKKKNPDLKILFAPLNGHFPFLMKRAVSPYSHVVNASESFLSNTSDTMTQP